MPTKTKTKAHTSKSFPKAVVVSMNQPIPDTISVREAAELLSIKKSTAYRRCEDGSLPALRMWSTWRVLKADANRLARGQGN